MAIEQKKNLFKYDSTQFFKDKSILTDWLNDNGVYLGYFSWKVGIKGPQWRMYIPEMIGKKDSLNIEKWV